ncbi:hypothetical protein I79_015598 [Cricetulus griseus]|uniref:Uncharacterized protein n=1 Tax=Cricetulus griseus TaxID=10029 RepID=G3HX79_CRIGR|nr:hypothetical protein I79_015598 [Cricetulus griseus]
MVLSTYPLAPQKEALQAEFHFRAFAFLFRIGLYLMREVLGYTGKGCHLLGRVTSNSGGTSSAKETAYLFWKS